MQRYAFFDSEDGDRVYSAEDWARIFRRMARDGYVNEEGEELEVTATDPVTLGVRVGLGAAWIQGRIYQIYDSAETLTLPDADLDNPRIDRIVVRLDYGDRLITVAVKEGTPEANPAPPALTRDSSAYELSLAQVYIAPAVTSISNADITDERDDKNLCGRSYSVVNREIPRGLISMWSGAISDIPESWALCDGNNGTPDLRDRFIVGAGSSYEVGDTGGTDNVTLTENQIPQHTHGSGTLSTNSTGTHRHGSGSLSTSSAGNHRHKVSEVPDTGVVAKEGDGSYNSQAKTKTDIYTEYAGDHTHSISGYTSYAGSHSHTVSGDTSSAGGGEAHENRPPYYALAYIMKI